MDPTVSKELSNVESDEELLHVMRRKLIRVGPGPKDHLKESGPKVVPVQIGPVCVLAEVVENEPEAKPGKAEHEMMKKMNGILFGVRITERVKFLLDIFLIF